MCEHCGKDHPVFEDLKSDLAFLDKIWDAIDEAEVALLEEEGEDGVNVSITPYVIPYFNHATASSKVDSFMEKCSEQGIPIRKAVIMFAESMMNSIWALAKLTGEMYQPTRLTDHEFAFPTTEEVSAWVDNQNQMAETLALVEIPDFIRDALKEAGVDIPENLKVRLPDHEAQHEQTGEEGITGLYL